MRDNLKSVLGAMTVHFIAGLCLILLNRCPLSGVKKQDQKTCVSLVWQGEYKTQTRKLNESTVKSSSVSSLTGDVGGLKFRDRDVSVKTPPLLPQKKVVTYSVPKNSPSKNSEKNDHTTFVPASSQKFLPDADHSLKGGNDQGTVQKTVAKLIPVYMPKPDYPVQARRLRQEGVALVRVWLTKDARVMRCSLERTTGFQSLDTEALKAVSSWRFRVSSGFIESALVPVRFSLKHK